MPWEQTSVMDQKLLFVADCVRGEEPMSVLCERYGISRQTGYVWWERYRSDGPRGLEERSRAPHEHGGRLDAELTVRLIEARRRWPHWGPKKLLAKLKQEAPQLAWPAPSTASEILRRHGLSEPRRRKRRSLRLEGPFGEVKAPNDLWCIDFKGWFRTRDGRRCDPFTATDALSRYLLTVKIVEPVTASVQAEMDRLFQEHGVPLAIRSDNGPPFASSGAGGLTRLSARWAKMGIALERIEPGEPQQNGSHERMHRTLKPEACEPPSANPAAQQARFDAFQQIFNHERPHEALGQIQPAELYKPQAPQTFVEPRGDVEYGPEDQIRRIRSRGQIKWNGQEIFVSEAIVGELVALRQQGGGHWIIRFAEVPLGLIDRASAKFTRFGPRRPPKPEAAHQPSRKVSGMYPG
jgi:putative transposase